MNETCFPSLLANIFFFFFFVWSCVSPPGITCGYSPLVMALDFFVSVGGGRGTRNVVYHESSVNLNLVPPRHCWRVLSASKGLKTKITKFVSVYTRLEDVFVDDRNYLGGIL